MKLTRQQRIRAAKLKLGRGVGNRKLIVNPGKKPERARNLPAKDDRYHTLPVKDPVMRKQPVPSRPKIIDDTVSAYKRR